MPVRIRIPSPLRRYTENRAEVTAEGRTVREIVESLEKQYPGIYPSVYNEDGTLKRFVNIYLNDEDVRFIRGDATEVHEGQVLSIVPAIAGGVGGRESP